MSGVELSLDRLGSKLRVWSNGSPDDPVVVLTHGAALNHRSFDRQIEALTRAGFRTVTWDLRGHGASQPLGARFGLDIVTDDLLAVMDTAGAATAFLVGHSFGGFVVQNAAAKAPDRVRGLVVEGCTDLSARPSFLLKTLARLAPGRIARMPLEQMRAESVKVISIRPEITADAFEATAALTRDDYVQVVMAGLDCLTRDSGLGQAYRLPCPTLITHGEQDKANGGLFPKASKAWAARQPDAAYAAIPEAGHTAHQDNPDIFNSTLITFLRRIMERD